MEMCYFSILVIENKQTMTNASDQTLKESILEIEMQSVHIPITHDTRLTYSKHYKIDRQKDILLYEFFQSGMCE